MYRKMPKLYPRPVYNLDEKNQCEDCDPNNKKKCSECSHATYFEWDWDQDSTEPKAEFKEDGKQVLFNPGFSVGTVAVRGSAPFTNGEHHFFEIEMSTEVYGTDMMVGVGTDKTNLRKFNHNFVSFLGYDEESWGLSYNGDIQHNGFARSYTNPFSQGDVIGVHVDLWAGTIEYYLNRKPLGVAFRNLKNKVLYPMISSTAARSGMTLTYARSFEHTLQLQALLSLGTQTFWPQNTSVFKCHDFPPGLRLYFKTHYWWITCTKATKRSETKENQFNQKQPIPRLRRKKVLSSTEESESDEGTEVETENSPCPLSKKEGAGNGTSPVSPSASPQTSRGRHVPDNKRLRLRSFNRDQ